VKKRQQRVSLPPAGRCSACRAFVYAKVYHRCGEPYRLGGPEGEVVEVTATSAVAEPVRDTGIAPPAGSMVLTDPLSFWLEAVTALADRTEELARYDRRLGPELIGGDRFKALRKVMSDVKKATEEHRARAAATLERVKIAAEAIRAEKPALSLRALAQEIHAADKKRRGKMRIGRSPSRIEKLLAQLYPP
jgi:hypothetical protein